MYKLARIHDEIIVVPIRSRIFFVVHKDRVRKNDRMKRAVTMNIKRIDDPIEHDDLARLSLDEILESKNVDVKKIPCHRGYEIGLTMP